MTSDSPDDARRRVIRELLAITTNDPEKQLSELQALRRMFHDELAEAVQPAINSVLRERDRDDVESRRALCSWANEKLRLLGLTVKDPQGRPSILFADARDADDSAGRYRLEHRDSTGRAVRTGTSPTVPELTLMSDPPRPEGLARRFRQPPKDGPAR